MIRAVKSSPRWRCNWRMKNAGGRRGWEVRVPLLERWLGERWIGRCIRVDSTDLSMSQVQKAVDSPLPDVPVQCRKKAGPDGRELLVVDRDAFAREFAQGWVRPGLPPSPVR